MKYQAFHTPTYHFDSYGPGLQDAMVYYHRELTPDEIAKVSAILSPLLHRKHCGTAEPFFFGTGGVSGCLGVFESAHCGFSPDRQAEFIKTGFCV
jgi:hypothetical protein